MFKILLIEDDAKICEELCILLKRYGYDCVYSMDFTAIEAFVERERPHLILLDLNLPVFDGFYLCRRLRERSSVPIIVVTSRDSQMDELLSMNLGADDFIGKPYHPQILLARIAALLKRTYQTDSRNLEREGVRLKIDEGIISFHEKSVQLTRNELKILKLLMENAGRVLSRGEIMNELWQSDEFVDDNTLTVNIGRIRKKLEEIGVQDFLKTRRGQGYII